MSGFGRRLVPPAPSGPDTSSRPVDPDPEQVKSWFNEARSAEQPPDIAPLAHRILKILGFRRSG